MREQSAVRLPRGPAAFETSQTSSISNFLEDAVSLTVAGQIVGHMRIFKGNQFIKDGTSFRGLLLTIKHEILLCEPGNKKVNIYDASKISSHDGE